MRETVVRRTKNRRSLNRVRTRAPGIMRGVALIVASAAMAMALPSSNIRVVDTPLHRLPRHLGAAAPPEVRARLEGSVFLSGVGSGLRSAPHPDALRRSCWDLSWRKH